MCIKIVFDLLRLYEILIATEISLWQAGFSPLPIIVNNLLYFTDVVKNVFRHVAADV